MTCDTVDTHGFSNKHGYKYPPITGERDHFSITTYIIMHHAVLYCTLSLAAVNTVICQEPLEQSGKSAETVLLCPGRWCVAGGSGCEGLVAVTRVTAGETAGRGRMLCS